MTTKKKKKLAKRIAQLDRKVVQLDRKLDQALDYLQWLKAYIASHDPGSDSVPPRPEQEAVPVKPVDPGT